MTSAGPVDLVGIHQPNYLPWLGYFHKLRWSDRFVFLEDCPATRQSWFSRVNVRVGGQAFLLSAALRRTKFRAQAAVGAVELDPDDRWMRKHRSTIAQHYARAPFVNVVQSLLDDAFTAPPPTLAALNRRVIAGIASLLDIDTPMISSLELDAGTRGGTDRLVDLVRAAGGRGYLCGMGSDGYLEPERFAEAGLVLVEQRFTPPPYPQCGRGPFTPGLSILDALANIGPNATRALLDEAPPTAP